MTKKYKIIIIFLFVVLSVVIGFYYFNGQYNLSKTQEAIKTSIKHQETANDYSVKAEEYENKNDYANAIVMREKSLGEVSSALSSGLDVSFTAEGIYKDYLENDILLLKAISRLESLHIQLDRQKNGEYLADTANYNLLNEDMNKLKDEISGYQNKKAEIISQNQDKFKFLNQSL